MAFENIVGNEKVKQFCIKAIESNSVLHSYMFVGTKGIGKFLFAKEFAKEILCHKKEEPCKSCISFISENHPDFQIVKPDGANIKIEQIRNLINKILEKPIVSEKKVYIIDEAEKLTKEAANSLLKTLEEPPEYAVIILVTSNENILLNTIKSRCMRVSFESAENGVTSKYNEELYKQVENIFLNIENMDKIDIIQKSVNIYKAKEEIYDILDYINIVLFEIAKKDERYLNCVSSVEKAKGKLRQNANYDMTLDNMLFSIWEEINEKYSRSKV